MSCCASVEFKNKFCVCIPFRKRMKMKTPKWNGVANWQINLHLSLDKFATFINIRWTFKWQPNVSHAMSVRYVREMVTKSRTGARCVQNHRSNILYSYPPLEHGTYGQMKWLRWREKKTISILIICSKNCLFIKIKCNFRVNNGKTWKSMQSISDFIMMITGANVRTQHLTPISNHMSKIIIFDFRCHLQCCAVLCCASGSLFSILFILLCQI